MHFSATQMLLLLRSWRTEQEIYANIYIDTYTHVTLICLRMYMCHTYVYVHICISFFPVSMNTFIIYLIDLICISMYSSIFLDTPSKNCDLPPYLQFQSNTAGFIPASSFSYLYLPSLIVKSRPSSPSIFTYLLHSPVFLPYWSATLLWPSPCVDPGVPGLPNHQGGGKKACSSLLCV